MSQLSLMEMHKLLDERNIQKRLLKEEGSLFIYMNIKEPPVK